MIYTVLGFFFLALGFVGAFVPVLPTVPFLLLSAFFFMHSSERMYGYLINHRRFGSVIGSFMENRSIPKKARQKALLVMWASLIISMALTGDMRVILLLAAVGLFVSIYLLRLKTVENI